MINNMARYAHIKDGAIYKYLELTDAEVAEIPPHKQTYIVPVQENSRPPWNPDTHKAPVRTESINPTEVILGWTPPTPLTPQEIDARKEQKIPNTQQPIFHLLFNQENRIRVLEGLSPYTEAEFREYFKGLA